MVRIMAITLVLLFVSQGVQATAQRPDRISISGEKYFIHTNPLTQYLKMIGWEPPKDAAIRSSNWRGYLASWGIEAGKLILVDMTIEKRRKSAEDKRERKSILKTVFPNKKQIVAEWFNGALIVPSGERISYVHMGYGAMYERYQVLRIKAGTVYEHLHMSQSEFQAYKEKKFQIFRETKMFQSELRNLINGEYNWSEEQALRFMQSFYIEHYLSL